MKHLILGALGFLAWTASAAAPFPTANFAYSGKVQISNQQHQNASTINALRGETQQACRVAHRSLYAIESYFPQVKQLIGSKGVNFPVLYANQEFYRKRLEKRLQACTGGQIKLNLVGRCGTAQGTVAFVKVTFGFVGSTIHLCDEFFQSGTDRVGVLVHEFGRLENIGDSPNFDTNNIYVWDAITSRLAEPSTFDELGKLKAKP